MSKKKYYIVEFIDGDTSGVACSHYAIVNEMFGFFTDNDSDDGRSTDYKLLCYVPVSSVKRFTPVDQETFEASRDAALQELEDAELDSEDMFR